MENNNKFPPIALGTWSWGTGAIGGDQVFGNNLNEVDLYPVFDAAMEKGLNLWDTAVAYGMGASESILGKFANTTSREKIQISTKFTPQIAGDTANPVEEMLEASLKRLGIDYIDIYWIHNPADVERWTPYLAPLVKSGKVKRIGVSNHNLAQIEQAQGILVKEGVEISAIQNHYSLLYRSSEDAGILDYCKGKGITFFSYMVLEQGALSGRYSVQNPMPEGSQRAATYNSVLPKIQRLIEVMRAVGEQYEASVPQVAMAWAINKGTVPIIGVTKKEQVEDAVRAIAISLASDVMAKLESAAAATGVDTRGSWENPMV